MCCNIRHTVQVNSHSKEYSHVLNTTASNTLCHTIQIDFNKILILSVIQESHRYKMHVGTDLVSIVINCSYAELHCMVFSSDDIHNASLCEK